MENEKLFRDESIGKVIAKTAVPAVLTILIMIIYNMADMFFIGRTGDAMQVAAVALAAPLMSILSGFGTLVGSGGCAAIAIELGKQDHDKARKMSSFCCWIALGLGCIFTLVLLIFMSPILSWIGASENTGAYAGIYLRIIAFGAPFMIFASSSANIVRSEGAVKESMLGNCLGSVINIILDPILISVFKLGVAGAAIATVIGNAAAAIYFILYFKKRSSLSLNPSYFTIKRDISLRVLSLGLPTAIGILLMSISTIVRNNLVVQYGDSIVAAMGVSGKVTMIVGMLQMGICTGVQPVLAYNYGAGQIDRLTALLKRTALVTVVTGSILTLMVLLWKDTLISVFINDPIVIKYGKHMAAVSVVSGPIFGLCYFSTNFLQATGKATYAIFLSLLRQGIFLLPLILIFNRLAGLDGLIWAQPVSDILTTFAALALFFIHYNKTILSNSN